MCVCFENVSGLRLLRNAQCTPYLTLLHHTIHYFQQQYFFSPQKQISLARVQLKDPDQLIGTARNKSFIYRILVYTIEFNQEPNLIYYC